MRKFLDWLVGKAPAIVHEGLDILRAPATEHPVVAELRNALVKALNASLITHPVALAILEAVEKRAGL